jgi:chromosomal replication initiator protein
MRLSQMVDAPYRALHLTLRAVSSRTGIPRERLLVRCRGVKPESQARMIAMWVLHVYFGLSFPIIGQLFCGRDHSTIVHGYQRVDEDPSLKADAEAVVGILEG